MTLLSYLTLVLGVALGAAVVIGETPAPPAPARTAYGAAQPLGDGTARTFVHVDSAGHPTTVGVALSEQALNGLPAGPAGGGPPALALPAGVAGLPYTSVSLRWNPRGASAGPFTAPHVAVRFYTDPEAGARGEAPRAPEAGATPPPARYLPEGYVREPHGPGAPATGARWHDAADPAYIPGGPGFSEAFLVGSYGGRVAFAEPVVTKAFLERYPDHVEALPQPEAVDRDGYYPTRYRVRWNAPAHQYEIALEGLVYRTAS